MDIIIKFAENFIDMFVDMSFYIMLGLLFVGILNTFVKRDKILKHLGKDSFSSVVKASIIGVPLPLCSCGVVPTAVELKKEGASNGSVISFLISTPQTGVDSIFATYSIMGIVMAIFRPIAAFFSGLIGGAIVNIFAKHDTNNTADIEKVEVSCGCCHEHEHKTEEHSCCCHEHEPKVEENSCCCHEHEPKVEEHSCCCHEHEHKTEEHSCCCHEHEPKVEEHSCSCGCESNSPKSSNKFLQVFQYAFGSFLDEIAGHFMIGMLLASLITTFIPADFFVNLGLNQGILAMLAMVLIGLPMYICSTSSIPIALSLITKGLSYGSGFVFLFTGPVTNIASILVLAKSFGKKLTAIYIGCVIACSLVFGLILDFLIDKFKWNVLDYTGSSHGDHGFGILSIVVAVIFALLLIKSFYKRIKK